MSRASRGAFAWVGPLCAAALAAVGACRSSDEVEPSSVAIAKVTPKSVSTTDAWALFDRSTSTGFVPGTAPIHIELDRNVELSAVKIAGSAPYRLQLSSGGQSIGFAPIDLSLPNEGWRGFGSMSSLATTSLDLTFLPTTSDTTAAVRELELWGTREDESTPLDRTAALDALVGPLVAMSPDVASAELLPDVSSTPCATFSVPVSRAPETFRRIHLVYTADGIAGPFALRRTVNGIAESGGTWLEGTRDAAAYTDELDPTALHLGTNEVRLCLPRDASRGVALSNVHLIGELDDGWHNVETVTLGDDANDVASLSDLDQTTLERRCRRDASRHRVCAPHRS